MKMTILRVFVPGLAIAFVTGCLSKAEPDARPARYVTVGYGPTDDIASRFAVVEGGGNAGEAKPVLTTSGRMPAGPGEAALRSYREQILAATADGRKETHLLAMGLEAQGRGDVGTAVARTREAWISLQATRSRTLDEDLAGSPVREAALAYASALLASTQSREGLLLLEKVVVASPAWMPAYTELFEYYLAQGSGALAEKVARRALAFTDESAGAGPSLLLARALRARKKPGEALEVLKGAEARFPNESVVGLWVGVALHDAGFLTDACERFSLAYARLRGDEQAAYNHALCLSRDKRWDQARDVVKLAMTQHPQSISLRLLAGNVDRTLGRDAEAYRSWREFLEMSHPRDPRRAHVENALADLGQIPVLDDAGAAPTKLTPMPAPNP